jgi:hypothetical protein
MSSLLTQGIKFFLNWIKAFEENHQTIKTIVVIDRGMEFSEKLKTMAISGNQLIQNLYKLKSIDLTWGYGIMMINYPKSSNSIKN